MLQYQRACFSVKSIEYNYMNEEFRRSAYGARGDFGENCNGVGSSAKDFLKDSTSIS